MTLGPAKLRQQKWCDLAATQWDAIVIGGGITGAGIACELARHQLNVLLVEQKDFAWGTSSRSSKMVHGGLRYIAEGDIKLTRESVVEREKLLKSLPGLVYKLPYLFAARKNVFPNRFLFGALLALYDLLAGKWDHRFIKRDALIEMVPEWRRDGLIGATEYSDAVTDDARLVLRVLQQAEDNGATALNYVAVDELYMDGGQVAGVVAKNVLTNEVQAIKGKVVINATGAWADKVRQPVNSEKRVRPLRGSHLVVSQQGLKVSQAITFMHPKDKRPVFVFPWEGRTVIGTTDVDHGDDLSAEASISLDEFNYLLAAVNHQFPDTSLAADDVIATYSGVRPVVSSGKGKDPSKERRDHSVWVDQGLITVTGGKLTTFRVIAWDVLAKCSHLFNTIDPVLMKKPLFNDAVDSSAKESTGDPKLDLRLQGRYGGASSALLNTPMVGALDCIADTHFVWAELVWACEQEMVCFLDDLLLRRTRIGLLLPQGGAQFKHQIKNICMLHLAWDEKEWEAQWQRYQSIYAAHYAVPSLVQAAADTELETA